MQVNYCILQKTWYNKNHDLKKFYAKRMYKYTILRRKQKMKNMKKFDSTCTLRSNDRIYDGRSNRICQ